MSKDETFLQNNCLQRLLGLDRGVHSPTTTSPDETLPPPPPSRVYPHPPLHRCSCEDLESACTIVVRVSRGTDDFDDDDARPLLDNFRL